MASRPAVFVVALALGQGTAARALAEPTQADDAPVTDDDASRARALYDEGVARADERDYAAAARAFESSYALAPTREALFGWAQAERLGGRCEQALALYDRFLATAPTEAERQAADIGRRRCTEALRATPATPPPPPPPPAPEAPTRPLWPSATLLATSGLALAAGTVLFIMSVEHDDAAAGANDYATYRDAVDRARLERALGLGLGGLGVLLAASGAAYLLWPTRGDERATRIALSPGPAGLGLSIGGRF